MDAPLLAPSCSPPSLAPPALRPSSIALQGCMPTLPSPCRLVFLYVLDQIGFFSLSSPLPTSSPRHPYFLFSTHTMLPYIIVKPILAMSLSHLAAALLLILHVEKVIGTFSSSRALLSEILRKDS